MLGWALNEEASLGDYVHRAEGFLSQVTDDFELVLIDDGSTDATWTVMNDLAQTRPWLRIVKNDGNRGTGYCYRKAINVASKDYFLAQTVDWAYDLTQIGQSLHLLERFDVLQGVRSNALSWHGLGRRSDSIGKAVVSFVNYALIRVLFRLPLRDYQNVTVCPTERVQRIDLVCDSSFANPEVLLKMWWHGMTFLEVPVRFERRIRGTATGTRIQSIVRSIREILVCWFRWVVLRGYPHRRRGRIERLERL